MLDNEKSDNNYITHVAQRLVDNGYRIKQNVNYKQQIFRCVGKRNRFRLWPTSIEEIFVIITEFTSIDINVLDQFSFDCRKYAKRHRLVPYLALTGGVLCFPVAFSYDVDSNTERLLVSKDPFVGYGYTEMPAIVNLTIRTVSFSEQTPWLGLFFLDDAREILNDLLHTWKDVEV